MSIHTLPHTHRYMHSCINTLTLYTYIHTGIYTHIYMHPCIHTYKYMHTLIYTYRLTYRALSRVTLINYIYYIW